MIAGYVRSMSREFLCSVVLSDEVDRLNVQDRVAVCRQAEKMARERIARQNEMDEHLLVGLMTESDAKRLGAKVEPWPTC